MTTFTAIRTPRQPGPAAWNCLLPDAPKSEELSENVTADVAIIGAGFAGLAAARRLIQLDETLRVIVLDACALAEGPAGRNSGFMIDLPHDLASEDYSGSAEDEDRKDTTLNRMAIEFAKTAANEYIMPQEFFDPCGKINAAATARGEAHNQSYSTLLGRINEPYDMYNADDMRRITGTDYYISGLFTPGTVMLQPAGYIRAFARGLRHHVSIFERCPVTSITRDGDSWSLSTSKARISASRVILANNGHAESLGFFERRLMHVFTYASMTAPIPDSALGGQRKWGATPADPMGTTVRRFDGTGGNRIIIRTRFTYDPSMEVCDDKVAKAGALHERKFVERFPMLKDLKMEYRWAGHLCLSRNNVPAHGEIENGIFSAVCQNGLGTAKGTLSGVSAAELAMGMKTEVSRKMLAMPKPTKLPPEPFASIGANAYLKWKEWRAGRE